MEREIEQKRGGEREKAYAKPSHMELTRTYTFFFQGNFPSKQEDKDRKPIEK